MDRVRARFSAFRSLAALLALVALPAVPAAAAEPAQFSPPSGGSARQVHYVVQCDTSAAEAWPFMQHEVLRSIAKLKVHQHFRILLCGSEGSVAAPLGRGGFMPPGTAENKLKAAEAIAAARHSPRANVSGGLLYAASLDGDRAMVFLVVAGETPDLADTARYLKEKRAGDRPPINVVHFALDGKASEALKSLAEDNNGTYRLVHEVWFRLDGLEAHLRTIQDPQALDKAAAALVGKRVGWPVTAARLETAAGEQTIHCVAQGGVVVSAKLAGDQPLEAAAFRPGRAFVAGTIASIAWVKGDGTPATPGTGQLQIHLNAARLTMASASPARPKPESAPDAKPQVPSAAVAPADH